MSDTTDEMWREAQSARVLLDNLRDVLGDDDDAAADAIEGETNFKEACAKAVERLAELDAHDTALQAHIEKMRSRRERLQTQAGAIRAALAAGLSQVGIKKLELPIATLSCRPIAAGLVITDEASIPAEFWKRGDPKLDRKALLAALKENHPIAGATLSNGGETIAILEK